MGGTGRVIPPMSGAIPRESGDMGVWTHGQMKCQGFTEFTPNSNLVFSDSRKPEQRQQSGFFILIPMIPMGSGILL